ncbi:MAG: LysR family transcriptional regulator [Lachnospiraceae bacterium]|nr:LysR family transcriptional regulator [Lachnospiraceae bacterium]
MTEKDFLLLKALYETENITRAADRLFITQSALSKKIMAIEEELDTEILIRSRQGIRFTPAGEEVYRSSIAAARELEEMRVRLDSIRDTVCGTLRAGISINYALYRLPDVLASYHKKYPKVRLNIRTGQSQEMFKSLSEGKIDIAVLRGDYPWDGTKFLLSQESVCVICSRENKGRPLTDYTYISHQTDPMQSARISRWLRENGIRNAGGFSVDSIAACTEMAARGIGWAIVPEIALNRFGGDIRPCTFEDGEPFVRRTYIYGMPDAMELSQVRLFMEALKKGKA